MRNLKKILALVLALVMSLSLMATAGAADFSDKDQITDKYSTAIEVLNGLEVFKGYDNGATFKPQGDITRAEVAAIIYRIATGDVTDTQKDIYSTWGLFTDVADGSWYAGYVNYCANAGYIKGRGNKIFDPNGKVTGYEALAMILRAIGYDKNNEFSGSNWQVNTASIAKQRGITNNITDTLLGQAATREVVAEILFRSILVPQVQFNTATLSYTNKDLSLGYEVLKLEEVTGVVVANEYANLEDDSVLAEGKTGFDVKGSTRTLDYGTELTDIGESRFAYLQNSKVLSIADSGKNTVFDNTTTGGDGVQIETKAKFKKASGIEQQDSTEFFTNFGFTGLYDSDYRIQFKVEFSGTNAKNAFNSYKSIDIDNIAKDNNYTVTDGGMTFEKVFRAGDKITESDLKVIAGIFGMADDDRNFEGVEGSVWVGSNSKNLAGLTYTGDKSNEMSYNAFKEQYINAQEKGNWNEGDDGEWVKIVDNDGDGKAEYAFLTTFTLDKVVSTYTKDGTEYNEFYALDITDRSNPDNTITARYMNDVAVGDIVLHTTIDKQALIWKAETDEDSVKLVSHKDRSITTLGDVTYKQSLIDNVTRLDDDVTTVDDSVNYRFYKDAFGRVRAFEPVDGNKYALLTELYFNGGQNDRYIYNRDLTVELFAASSSGKEYNVSNASASDFILRLNNGFAQWGDLTGAYGAAAAATSNRGKWQENVLQPATNYLGLYAERTQARIFEHATTNVARYITEKNGDIRLISPETYSGTNTYDVRYVDLVNKSVKADQDLYDVNPARNLAGYDDTLRALSTTEFYIVSKDGVSYFTDYRNMPKVDAPITAAYAVARSSERTTNNIDRNYWVADVIVIEAPEFKVAEDDLLLVLGLQTWWDNDVQSTNSRLANTNQNLLAISSKTGEVVRVIPNNRSWGFAFTQPGLYRVWGLEDVEDGTVSADRIEYVDLLDGTSNVANTYKLKAGTVEATNEHAEGSTRYLTVLTKNNINGKATTGKQSLYANAYNWAVLESVKNNKNIDTVSLRFGEIGDRRIQKGDNILWIEGSNNAAKFIVDLSYSNDDVAKGFRQTPTWLKNMWSEVVYEQTRYTSSTSINVIVEDQNGNRVPEAVMFFDEKGLPMDNTTSTDGVRSFFIPSSGNTDRYLVKIAPAYGYTWGDATPNVFYRNSGDAVENYGISSNGIFDIDVSNGTIVIKVKSAVSTLQTGVWQIDTNGVSSKIASATIGAAIGRDITELTVTNTSDLWTATETVASAKVFIGGKMIQSSNIEMEADRKGFTVKFDKAVTVDGDVYVVYTLAAAEIAFDIVVPTNQGPQTQSRSNARLALPQPLVGISINGKGLSYELINNGAHAKFSYKCLVTDKLDITIFVNTNVVPAGKNVEITWNGVETVISRTSPLVLKNQSPEAVKVIADETVSSPMEAEITDKPATVPTAEVGLKQVTVNGMDVTSSIEGSNGAYTITGDVYALGNDVSVTVRAVANDSTQNVTISTGSTGEEAAPVADNSVTGKGSATTVVKVAANSEVTVTITVTKDNVTKTYALKLSNKAPTANDRYLTNN